MNQHLSNNWIEELNETDDKANAVAEFKATEELKDVELKKLQYTYLAKLSRQFQTACIRIMTEIERKKDGEIIDTRSPLREKQINKFVFLVDNSGSMTNEKLTLALKILIVLLESLKRMEYQTAVVRFGGDETVHRSDGSKERTIHSGVV